LLRLKPKTFLGIQRRSWSSTDLCIDLSHYSAGCSFPKHGHVSPFFCFVLNGTCEERFNCSSEGLRPGSLVYHPAGFEHSNHWHEAGRCLHVEFVSGLCKSTYRLSEPVLQTSGSRACHIARNIYKELLHLDAASGIAFEGLSLLLLAETLRETSRENKVPRWLRSVRDRLHEEYGTVPSLRKMAADTGVHPTYLAASFQQHFGVTVGEFVRSRRVDQAREMLANSDKPLSEVALVLGFSDQSHFCRTFKKQTGHSPLEYRRLFAGNPNLIQES
jgi:AraC family transcriptional regulator